MARPGLNRPSPAAVSADAIARYLDALAGALPTTAPPVLRREIVAEIEDGLREAVARQRARGLDPGGAAAAGVAEFGDPAEVAAGFAGELAAAAARRVGLRLLLTGPLIGLTWLTLVTLGAAGRRPPGLPLLVPLLLALLALAVPSAVLSVALTGRLSRRLPGRPGLASGAALLAARLCMVADAGLLGALTLWAGTAGPGPLWVPAVAAATASTLRLILAGRAAHRCRELRASLA
jgi:hypothetical protein